MSVNDIQNLFTSLVKSETKYKAFDAAELTQASLVPDVATSDEFIPQAGSKGKMELRKEVEKYSANKEVAEEPVETRQYADCKGHVTHMALMLSSMYQGRTRGQILNAYKTMFLKMEPTTKFTICYETQRDKEDIEKVINQNNVPNPERIKLYKPDKEGLTIWARDMLVSSFNPGTGKSYMINSGHIHSRDGEIPPYIAEKEPSLGIVNTPTLVTDGGDTVANARESFVGYDSIEGTADKLKDLADHFPEFNNWVVNYYNNVMGKPLGDPEGVKRTPDKALLNSIGRFNGKSFTEEKRDTMFEHLALRLFEDYFGKPVTAVGKDDPATEEVEGPAVFHQDMCMTPIDDKTFFLGDPELFEQMCDSLSPEDRESAERQFSRVSNKLVGFDEYMENTEKHNNFADFEAYRKILEGKGYNVIRLPYRYSKIKGVPSFTYNNCLMESFEKDGKQVKRVFLPIIGVDVFDDNAIKAYKDQGFQVIPIPMGDVCKLHGELRCITNWLERSEKA